MKKLQHIYKIAIIIRKIDEGRRLSAARDTTFGCTVMLEIILYTLTILCGKCYIHFNIHYVYINISFPFFVKKIKIFLLYFRKFNFICNNILCYFCFKIKKKNAEKSLTKCKQWEKIYRKKYLSLLFLFYVILLPCVFA